MQCTSPVETTLNRLIGSVRSAGAPLIVALLGHAVRPGEQTPTDGGLEAGATPTIDAFKARE